MITSSNPEVLAKVDWGTYAQAILGALLFVLAIVLAVEGCMTIFGKGKKNPVQRKRKVCLGTGLPGAQP